MKNFTKIMCRLMEYRDLSPEEIKLAETPIWKLVSYQGKKFEDEHQLADFIRKIKP